MRKNNLVENKGLSLSQAQSISNICNQKAGEISNELLKVNNYSKIVKHDGDEYHIQDKHPLPDNVKTMLFNKAGYHAVQAYLMENIKAKEELLSQAKNEQPDLSSIEYPETPDYNVADLKPLVNETWGWEQLKSGEINEYLEVEAKAAHIGQFIHKGGILDRLRNELPNVPTIDWITIEEGRKTPVVIKPHHSPDQLFDLYEELAAEHRKAEQKVNYYKAKVKNLVNEKNAEISKENNIETDKVEKINSELREKYNKDFLEAKAKEESLRSKFEIERHEKIKKIATMRIDIDPRFQTVIDGILKNFDSEEE